MGHRLNSASMHHFLKAAILIGFSIYIFWLTFSGDILQFVVPQLVIYIKIAAGFLIIVAAFQFYIAFLSLKKQVIICDCGHDHDHSHDHDSVFGHEHHHLLKNSIGKNILIYGLFLLPLLLGFVLPNNTLSSSLVENKGMNLGGISSKNGDKGAVVEVDGNADPALKKLFKTNVYDKDYAKLGMKLYKQNVIEMKDEWFIEKLQSMNTFVDNFQSKEIKIKGFIYREPGLSNNQFIIARMGMTHCIADISPFGIIAEADNPDQFANDSWFMITGRISKTNFNGQNVIKIEVEKAEPAVSPSVPYVYPDWKFGSKL
ncbi:MULTISPECIES: TIGR03943 family putative permease subunit [Neobacillus]|uniref:TIGR03943 family protein n=1 Tax=Neobacillus rhizophilus TaxID=2833579 RepID=A0A942U6P4_9BACI|nr:MULTISPECIES: TIGR03943 family protein [Neobacillus]MBS4213922.1 TIGR03943 family protein [Neobacillus rhizophilus]